MSVDISTSLSDPMQSNADVHHVLILEPDPLRGTMIAQSVRSALPSARVQLESVPGTAAVVLAENDVTLFIVTLHGFDLDILTLLGVWAEHDVRRTRVLIVTPDANSSAIAALRSLPIHGIVDLRQADFQELERAFRLVLRGDNYRSGSSIGAVAVPCVVRYGLAETCRLQIDLPEVAKRFHRRFRPPRS